MITFDQNRCIGCRKCAWDCFPGAITIENKQATLTAPANCIGCGHCIAVCPVGAVSDPDLPCDDVQSIAAEHNPDALLSTMRARRSCRHYTDQPVTQQELSMLLGAARACPTAKNLQGTRYISVTKSISALLDAALEGLGHVGTMQLKTATDPGELRRARNFIAWQQTRKEDKTFDPLFFHAPQLLMFVSDKSDVRDAAAAAAYAELMAAELGLGCLYSGYFTACCAGSKEIQTMLGLKDNEQVVRCLVLGHPDIKFRRTAPRKPVSLTEL